MKELIETFLKTTKSQFKTIEQAWKNQTSDRITCYIKLKDLKNDTFYYVIKEEFSDFKDELYQLHHQISALMETIKHSSKSIFVLEINNDKTIAVSNESLVQKCIERLKNENVKFTQMKVCENEEDLDEIFLEDKMKEELKNPRIVHLLTDKDCPLY